MAGRLSLGMPIRLRIAELRETQHISVRELAKRAGVSPTTIVNLEAGVPRSLGVLEKIANALNVDAGYLIVHEHKPFRRSEQ